MENVLFLVIKEPLKQPEFNGTKFWRKWHHRKMSWHSAVAFSHRAFADSESKLRRWRSRQKFWTEHTYKDSEKHVHLVHVLDMYSHQELEYFLFNYSKATPNFNSFNWSYLQIWLWLCGIIKCPLIIHLIDVLISSKLLPQCRLPGHVCFQGILNYHITSLIISFLTGK